MLTLKNLAPKGLKHSPLQHDIVQNTAVSAAGKFELIKEPHISLYQIGNSVFNVRSLGENWPCYHGTTWYQSHWTCCAVYKCEDLSQVGFQALVLITLNCLPADLLRFCWFVWIWSFGQWNIILASLNNAIWLTKIIENKISGNIGMAEAEHIPDFEFPAKHTISDT